MTLTIVWRGCANTWECDEMGHMNVRHYLNKAGEGLDCLALELGHPPSLAHRTGIILVPAEQHVRYQREVRAGTPLTALAGVIGVSADRIKVYLEIRMSFDNTLSATIVTDLIAVDASSRLPQSLPQSVIDSAQARVMELPAHGAPKGLVLKPARTSADLATAQAMGLAEIYRGSVQPSQVDGNGVIVPYHLMGMISDGIGIFLLKVNPDRGRAPGDGGSGGAALEYRFVYRRAARLGDLITIQSGLIGLTDKTQIFGHWIMDMETGAAIATAEAVAVGFDLTTRKIIPISPDNRARMEAVLVPGLSA
jgi:acyl-CoA thioester hydrolase